MYSGHACSYMEWQWCLKDDNALAEEVGEKHADEMQDEIRLKQMLGEKKMLKL
jgi:hypothetical protein